MAGGFFGNLFDLNHDGNLDTFEQAMDFAAFMEVMSEEEESEEEDDD